MDIKYRTVKDLEIKRNVPFSNLMIHRVDELEFMFLDQYESGTHQIWVDSGTSCSPGSEPKPSG